MEVNLFDLLDYARLDMQKNQMRLLQGKADKFETRCIGSGKCCKVALKLPLLECASIAFNLKREFYLKMEDKGEEKAQEWWDELIFKLKDAFNDKEYEVFGGNTDRYCPFYKNGCSIYSYRPLVCASYGVIFTVDEFCPRKRLEGGTVELFKGEAVKKIVQDYMDLCKEFGARHPDHNFSVFMPLGVLHFLLPVEEMQELKDKTDEKFWKASEEYSMAWVRSILEGISIDEIGAELEELSEDAEPTS